MAYRQLGVVSLVVLGLVSVGCGGDTTSAGSAPVVDEQAPANQDQPPDSGSDRIPSNTDAPPRPAEAPPDSADEPARTGGQLVNLCKKFCSAISTTVDKCSMGMGMNLAGLDALCSEEVDCQVPANFPCVSETGELLDCFMDSIGRLCSGDQEGANAANFCADSLKDLQDCAAANNLDGNGNGNGNSGAANSCTSAGGCSCRDALTTCVCRAGNDVAKIQACTTDR